MLGQWVCLEINILCIIPILVCSITEDSIITGVKYFISQSAASLLFILGLFLFNQAPIAARLIVLSILFKLGLPPMQSWLVRILPRIDLIRIYLVFTVQKIIPLTLLRFIKVGGFIYIFIVVRAILFLLSRLTQVRSLFILILLSSIVNGIWALRCVGARGQWGLFIFFYSLILLGAIVCLNSIKIFKVGNLANKPLIGGVLVSLQFLNLGGLPPLLGFIVKLMIIKQLAFLSFRVLAGLLRISLIVLFIYVSFAHQRYCFNRNLKVSGRSGWASWIRALTLVSSGVGLWIIL